MVMNGTSKRVPHGARGIVRTVTHDLVLIKWTDAKNERFNTVWVSHNDIVLIGEDDYYTEKEKANFKAMKRVSLWANKWRKRNEQIQNR
jgi:hypothetical protein